MGLRGAVQSVRDSERYLWGQTALATLLAILAHSSAVLLDESGAPFTWAFVALGLVWMALSSRFMNDPADRASWWAFGVTSWVFVVGLTANVIKGASELTGASALRAAWYHSLRPLPMEVLPPSGDVPPPENVPIEAWGWVPIVLIQFFLIALVLRGATAVFRAWWQLDKGKHAE